jgi:hypothetical protein
LIDCGYIYDVYTVLTNPPKKKIVLCVSVGDSLFLWINTEARRHGVGQLQLCADDHGRLEHDSFLDCSRLTTFPKGEIAGAVSHGVISAVLARRIAEFLTANPPKTLPKRQLELAIGAFAKLAGM